MGHDNPLVVVGFQDPGETYHFKWHGLLPKRMDAKPSMHVRLDDGFPLDEGFLLGPLKQFPL